MYGDGAIYKLRSAIRFRFSPIHVYVNHTHNGPRPLVSNV